MGEMSGYGNLNKFFSTLSKKLGNLNIWKMYFFGRPSAVRIQTFTKLNIKSIFIFFIFYQILSGSDAINKMLEREFRSSNGIVSQVDSFGDSELIFGKNSMSSVLADKKE